MSIKHKFNSGIPDGLDPALVKPSDWNNDHFVDFDGLSKSASGVLVQALPGVDYLTPTGSGATLTGITAAQVGLGNVTNESKATMFTSPAFTGTPTAPTAAANTNTTQIASCEFVIGQASNASPAIPQDAAVVGTSKMFARGDHGHPSNFTSSSSDLKMDGTAAVGVSTKYVRADHVHPTDTSRAPLASPTFTGTVTSPQFASTIATGTAPFTVASTTLVSNLNAQYIGGTPLSGLEPAITTLPVAKGGTGATASTGTGSVVLATSPTFTGTVTLPDTTSIGTVSGTEISYLDGVTSGIQTQINGKSPIAGPGSSQAFSVGALSATGVSHIFCAPDVNTGDSNITSYASGAWFVAKTTNVGKYGGLRVVDVNNNDIFSLTTEGSSGAAQLRVAGTERLRVATTGNLLIGTTTDDGVNKLQVSGSASASAYLIGVFSVLSPNADILRIGDIGNNYTNTQLFANGGSIATISYTGLAVTGGISASALPVYADNTAAAALATGTMYRTSTGVVMIKY